MDREFVESVIGNLARVLQDLLSNDDPAVEEAAEALVGVAAASGTVQLAQTEPTLVSLILGEETATLQVSRSLTRMLLARLHVISTPPPSPYGGDVVLALEGRKSIRGEFRNTPDEQFVRLSANV